jgi:hypothetical protein
MALHIKLFYQVLFYIGLYSISFAQERKRPLISNHGVGADLLTQPTKFHDLNMGTSDNYGFTLEAFFWQRIRSKIYTTFEIQAGREFCNFYYQDLEYRINTYRVGLPINLYYQPLKKPLLISFGIGYLHTSNQKASKIQLPENMLNSYLGINYLIRIKQYVLIPQFIYTSNLNSLHAEFDLPALKTSSSASKNGITLSLKFM